MADEDIVCGICGDTVDSAAGVACARCSSPHHGDCWDFNGGCAVFACGGREQVPFQDQAATLQLQGVTIHEGSRPPLRLSPVLEGLRRRFWSRLPFMARTVPAGLLGSAAALAVAKLVRADPVRKDFIALALLLSGGLYGAVAPFLAPTQLRHPRALALVGFLVSVGTFALLDGLRIRNAASIPFWLLIFVAALTFAAASTEVVAGYRTALGERLGAWGPVARGLLAWLGVALVIVVLPSIEDGRLQLDGEILTIALSMGLMGGAVAVPAMEQGKKAFLAAVGQGRLTR